MSAGRLLWGAIVLFVLALAVCAVVVIVRDNTGSASASVSSGVSVDAKGIAFVPKSLAVNKGAEVTFTNRDAVPHTVTADDKSIDSGIIAPGKAFKIAIAKPFTYHCEVHPSMKAKIELSG